MADEQPRAEGSRPSFSSFWKKGKEKLKGRGITFVDQGNNSSPGDDQSSPDKQSKKDKAQARRAQVRKAQIQHRQRKANYVSELELDVAKYRELIAKVEHEAVVLKRENDSIKIVLSRAGIDALAAAQDTDRTAHTGVPQLQGYDDGTAQQSDSPELFSGIDIDDLTVTLGVDETMGTPCLNISSSSSSESIRSIASPVRADCNLQLSPEQEQKAINFILALEHVCWNHFTPATRCHTDDECEENGHSMMATAYCMTTAPQSIYEDRVLLDEWPAASTAATVARVPTTLQWQVPGLTLDYLYGLATSLNASDLEISPVQAWLELANRYGTTRLLDEGVLEVLKREFRGVVRCVFFGAVMERAAFESVVTRVLGSPLEESFGFNAST